MCLVNCSESVFPPLSSHRVELKWKRDDINDDDDGGGWWRCVPKKRKNENGNQARVRVVKFIFASKYWSHFPFFMSYTQSSTFCECPKPTPPNDARLSERENFFSSWWCWLPFISKFYPPESIYMEENYTVYRHINTFNSTLVVVVDDTMHTKIQLTIIWLDVSSFQIQIKLLHREIYPHFTWEFLAVANFSHRARFIPFLLAHLTLAAVNSAVQSFFCPSTWNATNKKFLIYAQSQT